MPKLLIRDLLILICIFIRLIETGSLRVDNLPAICQNRRIVSNPLLVGLNPKHIDSKQSVAVLSRTYSTTLWQSGYISPEKDPEYRNMVKKSLLLDVIDDVTQTYPLPKEGDVVLCQGKWKDEQIIGNIRSLRKAFYGNESGWVADVIPLTEGKTENVYVVNKGAKSLSLSTAELKPVKSFFIRAENGYKISFKPNSTVVSLRAPNYRKIDATTKLPQKILNVENLESSMLAYEELKLRIRTSTLQIGLLFSVPIVIAFGIISSLHYLLGVVFSVLYLYLLGRDTDYIGLGFSKRDNVATPTLLNKLAKIRFLVPLFLVMTIASGNFLMDHSSIQPFEFVTREQFIAAMAGFLTYRVSIFVSEVVPDLRMDDILGILPGSVAEGYRQFKDRGKPEKMTIVPENIPIIFVTGPKAAGRESIVDDLYSKFTVTNNKLRRWKAFTSDLLLVERYPSRYTYIDETSLSNLRENDGLIYETYEGQSKVAWSMLELTPGYKFIASGPPQLLDKLERQSGLKLTNVWLTAQTRDQFEEGARRQSPKQANELLDEAVKDISYFKDNASSFSYTLLSTWFDKEGDSLFELEQLMK